MEFFGTQFCHILSFPGSKSRLEKYLPTEMLHVVSASMGTVVASVVRVMSLTCFLPHIHESDWNVLQYHSSLVHLTQWWKVCNSIFIEIGGCLHLTICMNFPCVFSCPSLNVLFQVPSDTLKHQVQAYMHPNGRSLTSQIILQWNLSLGILLLVQGNLHHILKPEKFIDCSVNETKCAAQKELGIT